MTLAITPEAVRLGCDRRLVINEGDKKGGRPTTLKHEFVHKNARAFPTYALNKRLTSYT